jgi:endonuclease III
VKDSSLALKAGLAIKGVSKNSTSSPYFEYATLKPKKLAHRPPRGTISSVPFPRLSAIRFGLIQEEFSHNPFGLLIAVTFLVKTKGITAIPVFQAVMSRFPTPEDLANPDNGEELKNMIRHLGFGNVRTTAVQRIARIWIASPPSAHTRFRVRHYAERDIDVVNGWFEAADPEPTAIPDDTDDLEAWEVGHITQGRYAIDSWRIFCRDELLGRARDWNGEGREPEFQPEWMRVLPADKELRACLRWMWMREGWEWDPETGERTVLREEMRRAVNDGQVEYNDSGGLRILDEPRAHINTTSQSQLSS